MLQSMKRILGRSNIEVSALGMGCWAIGGPFFSGDQPLGWGEVDDNESTRAIHAALEHGVTFFDSADVYGAGHSEIVLGKALAGQREKVVIATKFGNQFDPITKQITGASANPEYIRAALDASLARLGTSYVDLYQFHLGGHDLAEAAIARDTLEELVTTGKIRAYAWSTDDPTRAALFAEGSHCTAVQHTQNILEDNAEMLELCQNLDLASINRGPLAMGLLTGKFSSGTSLQASDVRAKSPDWMVYFKDGVPNPEWLAKLESVREILTANGRTLTQGALAWLWSRSPRTIPIPGFRTVKQVQENAKALEFGALSQVQFLEVEKILR
jgi:aryl-alcohol dehydrogenase-like predicted oxidoreductase